MTATFTTETVQPTSDWVDERARQIIREYAELLDETIEEARSFGDRGVLVTWYGPHFEIVTSTDVPAGYVHERRVNDLVDSTLDRLITP